MSQHDFNIANQLFPATRADLNNAFVALASNSSGDAEPGTTYANQWWYETDTNTLKLRNEANSAWIEILDALTRGSLIYGNPSGVTSELVKGGANTVLTSDGTDISWAAAAGGGGMEFIASSGAISNGTTSVAFTQFDSSKYDLYKFFIQAVVPTTDNNSLFAQLSADGGSSYDSTNGHYHVAGTDRTGLQMATSVGNDTSLGELLGVGSEFRLLNNHSTTTNTASYTSGLYQYSGSAVPYVDNLAWSAMYVNSTVAHDGIRFLYQSGNIKSGEITMFGVVNS